MDQQGLAELQQAVKTKTLELEYERRVNGVEETEREEQRRRLELKLLLLGDANDELKQQISRNGERFEKLDGEAEELRQQLREVDEKLRQAEAALRAKSLERENLMAELESLHGASKKSTKLLTEKLSLERELETLKPEIDHLRSQSASHQSALAEKLTLQRELNTIKIELEAEKRATQDALAKGNKEKMQDEALREEIEQLRETVTKEQREKQTTERDLKTAQKDLEMERRTMKKISAREEKLKSKDEAIHAQLDRLREELAREKLAKQTADEKVVTLRQELDAERQAIQRNAAKNIKSEAQDAGLQSKINELREEIAREKRERQRAEREAQKARYEWEVKEGMLETKLDAFRTKLRSTKEQLKDAQAELQQTRSLAANTNARHAKDERVGKPSKSKKAAASAHFEADTMIGTPGGPVPGKKAERRVSAMPGEKSTFSITPFLNRTANIAPDTPINEEDASDGDQGKQEDSEKVAELEKQQENSPIVVSKAKRASKQSTTGPKTSKPAKAAATSKTGSRKRTVALPALDGVMEEEKEDGVELGGNEENVPPSETAETLDTKLTKTDSSSMNLTLNGEEPKKKKRKMLGGAKTLFDEDDGEAVRGNSKSLFGGSKPFGIGKGGLAGPRGGLKGGLGGASGFGGFSPLKKDRKVSLI